MMLSSVRGLGLILVFIAVPNLGSAAESAERPATSTQAKADPLDWPNWRGPEQTRVSRETGLIDKWDPETGENVLWKNEELGGISSPIVMNGRLYTIVRHKPDTQEEQEKVVCVDAATGEKIWESKHNVYLSDVPAERVGWSACVGDPSTGRVYAMGVNGYFQCLDGATGEELWSHSLSENYGLLSTYGGRTNFPIVFDDLVITSAVIIGWGDMALPAHRFIAFNKHTGEPVWFNGTRERPEDTTYSTPFLTVLNGQAAMVFGSGDGGVWAFQPRTGKPIWNFQLSRRGLNASPVVSPDGTVFAGNAEENLDYQSMGAIAAINGRLSGDVSDSAELWRQDGMVSKTSLAIYDGRLYACDDGGKLYIFDMKTGEPVGRPVKLVGTIVRSSPLIADGKVYVCTTSAWHVFQITENSVKPIHRMRMDEEDEVAGSPLVSHGRIYLPTVSRLYCLGTKDAKPAATKIPPQPQEAPASEDTKPAWVQVTPVEVLTKPGEKQSFTVRLFNARGQFLKEANEAKFSLDGPGEIDGSGTYTAASTPAHTATIVTAKVGDLTGRARIRVVPPLPWKWDFNDTPLVKSPKGVIEGEPPVTWVGMRYRHKIREQDGEKVMVKVNTIPKGTRSQGWFGPDDLHDYTIQADFQGTSRMVKVPVGDTTETRKVLPDMGLIAQRYTLDLMGASQQLQIRSWVPQIATRFVKNVPFEWDESQWYTMKFRASVEDGKAVLRGKVWKRSDPEPKQWTIEAVDEVPNLQGSPGMFGNANEVPFYIDNVSVTPNS